MRIYLDNCSLQRPLDDQMQLRIELETEAIIEILSACEMDRVTLISSEILLAEINDTSDLERKEITLGVLELQEKPLSPTRKLKSAPKRLRNLASSRLMRCTLPVPKRVKPNTFALVTINF